jgi:hypothetical protein
VTRRTTAEFAQRVTVAAAALAVAGAGGAAWWAGRAALVGVLVGAAVAIANFRWLARGVALLEAGSDQPRWRARSVFLVGARYLVTFGALAAPVAAGIADPVALGVGLTALPIALTTQGLRAGREEV